MLCPSGDNRCGGRFGIGAGAGSLSAKPSPARVATRSSLAVLAAPVIAAGLSFVVASPFVLLDCSALRESFAAMAGEHLPSLFVD